MTKNNIMIFTYEKHESEKTGREMLSSMNERALKKLFRDNVVVVKVDSSRGLDSISKKIGGFSGWLDGLTPPIVRECLDIIDQYRIDTVYIEGSNYGRLVREIHRKRPHCRLVTFFHNVESRFFWGAFKGHPSLKSISVLLANWIAEKWAVKYSDRIICLNTRDGNMLKRIYGRLATDIHPMCIESEQVSFDVDTKHSLNVGLFVGGAFYANIQGCRWLAQEVAPYVDCEIVIVGRGFEAYREELEEYSNVRVAGTVNSVSEWYKGASFVLAPIFDGSGMKTKVAEALMHGKPIIGTAEAFIGYEDIRHKVGFECQGASDFIEAIQKMLSNVRNFDPKVLRSIYENKYSEKSKLKYFEEFFQGLEKT